MLFNVYDVDSERVKFEIFVTHFVLSNRILFSLFCERVETDTKVPCASGDPSDARYGREGGARTLRPSCKLLHTTELSRALHEYAKERSYNYARGAVKTGKGKRERERKSLLVYDRDMTAAPDFILLCAIRADSHPCRSMRQSGTIRFSAERNTLRTESSLDDLLPLVPRVKSKGGKMDFRCTR